MKSQNDVLESLMGGNQRSETLTSLSQSVESSWRLLVRLVLFCHFVLLINSCPVQWIVTDGPRVFVVIRIIGQGGDWIVVARSRSVCSCMNEVEGMLMLF